MPSSHQRTPCKSGLQTNCEASISKSKNIDEDIANIKANILSIEEDVEDVRINVAHNKDLISTDELNINTNAQNIGSNSARINANQGQIADNVASLAANKAEIASNGEAIQTLVALTDELRDQLTAANAEIEILKQETRVPVGTIMAWTEKVVDGSKVPLPKGWALCDGSVIEDAESVWNGLRTPVLNDGRFLRGGSNAQVLEYEDDMVEDMNTVDYYLGMYGCKNGGSADHGNNIKTDGPNDDPLCVTTRKLSDAGNGGKVGAETRPKNMKVIYIIKIK